MDSETIIVIVFVTTLILLYIGFMAIWIELDYRKLRRSLDINKKEVKSMKKEHERVFVLRNESRGLYFYDDNKWAINVDYAFHYSSYELASKAASSFKEDDIIRIYECTVDKLGITTTIYKYN